MIYNPGEFTDNSPMSPSQSATLKKPTAIKPLRQLLYTLEVKPKTAVRRFCTSKPKPKSSRAGSMLWSSIQKIQVYLKTQPTRKNNLYNFILQHPQVVVYPIENDCIRLSNDYQVEPQLANKLLFAVIGQRTTY